MARRFVQAREIRLVRTHHLRLKLRDRQKIEVCVMIYRYKVFALLDEQYSAMLSTVFHTCFWQLLVAAAEKCNRQEP